MTATATALDEPPIGAEPTTTAPRPPRRPPAIGLHLALTIGLVVMALPFVWMVLGSFKTTRELRQTPPSWIPEDPTVENYQDLFNLLDFPQYFLNSTIAGASVAAGNVLFCSMLGYALAKLEFPGKRALMAVVLGSLMIPSFVTFMPLFVLVANMNLTNTRWGLILPLLAGAFGVFLMRQFMLGIPNDLLDAARVDGAGEFRIFFRIVLPLCGPALATLGVLTFLVNWNSFLWPLVVASDESQYTLPVALALFSIGQQESNVALQMAGATVVVLPVVVLFFAMQRYVIRGIATTGLK